MFTSMLVTVPVLIAQLALPARPTAECRFDRLGDPSREQRAIAAYVAAVEQYAESRRRLPRPWPLPTHRPGGEQALPLARWTAVPGHLFTTEVAEILRFRIRAAMNAHDHPAAPTEADDEGAGVIVLNAPLPRAVREHHWPCLEEALPRLPLELAYVFVGRDLVLLDVESNVVVDVIDLALPLR